MFCAGPAGVPAELLNYDDDNDSDDYVEKMWDLAENDTAQDLLAY